MNDFNILHSILESLSIPTWCIEFSDPVDLNGSDEEVIRQIFHNDSHWKLCNKAMAQLYQIPGHMDLNKQPVYMNFPGSLENQDFVQELIDSYFSLDDVLSIDSSHDGHPIYVLNTVRAHIEAGKLYRFWGTARDVTQDRKNLEILRQRETEMRGVLSSVPDVILVVDNKLILLGANPAFETELGLKIDDWLGKEVTEIIDLKVYTSPKRKSKPVAVNRFVAPVSCAHGVVREFEGSLASHASEGNSDGFVIVLRPLVIEEY
ncbi:MAG: hypothetical protein DRR42_04810 [Gammaproteobacteria bacterium]|nr:MAG: hypothetical protein DRR42_04810 [Gammaproteobacteria bacterium]